MVTGAQGKLTSIVARFVALKSPALAISKCNYWGIENAIRFKCWNIDEH